MKRIDRNFGDRFRAQRTKAGMSQGDVSKELGIYSAMYSRIENNSKQPPLEIVIWCAKYIFHCSTDALLIGDEK